jgi:hypothetical protein
MPRPFQDKNWPRCELILKIEIGYIDNQNFLFRFFTVTNPDEVTKNGAKPNLTEVGPYAYKEVRRKEDIFEVDNDKIQFGQYYEYHFDKAETDASNCVNSTGHSDCNDTDEIKVLNGALMAVVGLLQQYKITASTTFG